MTIEAAARRTIAEETGTAARPRVLVVDDTASQRMLIVARLRGWGYDVTEAANGREALERLDREAFAVVLSDWSMPEMSGIEFCRALRAGETDRHTYVILVTARHEKSDISEGLGAGADDFLTKPVDATELAARLKAGLRVVELQQRLIGQREEIAGAYGRLKRLHDLVERDLAAAAALQREVLPPPLTRLPGARVAALSRPFAHVGGDHVGILSADLDAVGIYSIDVSGHGVASALLAIRLAQQFDPGRAGGNVAYGTGPGGRLRLRAPDEVVAELNDRFLSGGGHDLYFTMNYAVVERATGHVRLCQAGHPPAVVLDRDGGITFHGEGGAPVGLLPGVTWSQCAFTLHPGERLLLHSDGLTDLPAADGGHVGAEGLAEALDRHASAGTERLLNELVADLHAAAPGLGAEDDLSAILLELARE